MTAQEKRDAIRRDIRRRNVAHTRQEAFRAFAGPSRNVVRDVYAYGTYGGELWACCRFLGGQTRWVRVSEMRLG